MPCTYTSVNLREIERERERELKRQADEVRKREEERKKAIQRKKNALLLVLREMDFEVELEDLEQGKLFIKGQK